MNIISKKRPRPRNRQRLDVQGLFRLLLSVALALVVASVLAVEALVAVELLNNPSSIGSRDCSG